MIGRRLAHYEILAQIGAGAMSEVYRARDTKLDRDVALKILPAELAADPARLQRFEREARIIAALNHPNIVTIHTIEESDGVHFITMEMIEGRSLQSLIPSEGFDLRRLLQVAFPLADALGAAHQKGITHRDLKPANIMVAGDAPGGEAHVKILDFGLAKSGESGVAPTPEPGFAPSALEVSLPVLEERDGASSVPLPEGGAQPMDESVDGACADSRAVFAGETVDGTILGTFPYMPPEQLRGWTAEARSDLFSLGVILYEMATGRRPFRGDTLRDLVTAILHAEPQPLGALRPDLPPELVRLVHHCLEKDTERRPRSAAVVRQALEAIVRLQREGGTARRSIAALPFADMSLEQDQDYFCEGIAEELIGSLVRIPGLRVAARTSAFKFKKADLDIRDIGLQLGVETVLEGSVRKSGTRLRVDVQLVSVQDGCHLWSGRYDREMRDVFAIQEEIARSIVESLQLTLAPGERPSFHAAPTSSPEAYDYYLRGRKAYYGFRRKSIELALRMFSLAIKYDPNYARAYAGIADCCAYLFLYADRSRASLDQADEASRKALELNPELPEAHASRGQVLSLAGEHAQAETEFEAAIRLGPQLFEAYYLYARNCFAQGKLERALHLFEKASEVSPEDYQSPFFVAQIYSDLGRPGDAVAARRRGIAIAREVLARDPDNVRALYLGANGLVTIGQEEQAIEWAALAQTMEPEDPMVLYNVACIYSLAGKISDALACLERAMRGGLRQKGWFDHDSNLDPLRAHPRFRGLMEQLQREHS